MGRVFFKDSQLPQSLGKEHGPFRKYPYLKALGLVGGAAGESASGEDVGASAEVETAPLSRRSAKPQLEVELGD